MNVMHSRFGLLKQTNAKKLEESPDQAGQQNPVENKPPEESLRAPHYDTNRVFISWSNQANCDGANMLRARPQSSFSTNLDNGG